MHEPDKHDTERIHSNYPSQIRGVIIGIVLYVNSDHIASAAPAGQNVLSDNIVLLSSLIIALSGIKLLIDWYLSATEDDI